jgi:hypothetical protein
MIIHSNLNKYLKIDKKIIQNKNNILFMKKIVLKLILIYKSFEKLKKLKFKDHKNKILFKNKYEFKI